VEIVVNKHPRNTLASLKAAKSLDVMTNTDREVIIAPPEEVLVTDSSENFIK
jgi:hypothetical protein